MRNDGNIAPRESESEGAGGVGVRRARTAIWVLLLANVLLALRDLWLGSPRLGVALGLKAVQVLVGLAGYAALASARAGLESRVVALAVLCSAIVLTGLTGWTTSDEWITPWLSSALIVTFAAVLPWGVRFQLIAGAAALATVALLGVAFGQVALPSLMVVVSAGAAVVIARQLEAQRRAERDALGSIADNEEFLRKIINGLPALIAYIDDEGRCRFANRAFEDWFGLARFLMNGQRLEDLIAPDAMAQLRPQVAAALGGREVSFEALFTDRYGHTRTFSVSHVPDTTPSGAVRGFFSLAIDITDRKHAEDAVRHHQRQLADALRLRTMGAMATALGRQLNRPLSSIVTEAESHADPKGVSDSVRESLGRIVDHVKRTGDILSQVEAFTRAGDPRFEPITVNHLVEDAVRLIEPEARRLGVGIQLRLASPLPLVEGDSIQVEQVLLNLLMNALQAIDAAAGGKRVIEVETLMRGTAEIEIVIRDSGVGLAAGVGKKMFHPYFTTRTDGLGMGLTISRSIVESHGGRLWATSNSGPSRAGATFRFTLPTSRPAANERTVA